MTTGEMLQKAYLLLKRGDKASARTLLIEVIRQNPRQDDAWVGLSFCVDTVERRRECLSRALLINSENRFARVALSRLDAEQAFAPIQISKNRVSQATPAAVSRPAQSGQPVEKTSGQTWSPKQVNIALGIIVTAMIGLIVVLSVVQNINATRSRQVASANGRYQFIEFYADW